jgi:hypothetical protein
LLEEELEDDQEKAPARVKPKAGPPAKETKSAAESKLEACPQCGSALWTPIGSGAHRCGQCGHQSAANVPLGFSRRDLESGAYPVRVMRAFAPPTPKSMLAPPRGFALALARMFGARPTSP